MGRQRDIITSYSLLLYNAMSQSRGARVSRAGRWRRRGTRGAYGTSTWSASTPMAPKAALSAEEDEIRRRFTELTNEQVELEFEVIRTDPEAAGINPASEDAYDEPLRATIEEFRRETRKCWKNTNGDALFAIIIGGGIGAMMLVVAFAYFIFR